MGEDEAKKGKQLTKKPDLSSCTTQPPARPYFPSPKNGKEGGEFRSRNLNLLVSTSPPPAMSLYVTADINQLRRPWLDPMSVRPHTPAGREGKRTLLLLLLRPFRA